MSIAPLSFLENATAAERARRLPDFLIIGAPKCGTTTLYEWLRENTKIYMPFKELGYFSQDIFPTKDFAMHIPSLDAYMTVFGGAPGRICSAEKLLQDIYSDRAITEIASLAKVPKIIVCLRDPIDLIISYHNQKVREGREPERDLAKAWARSLDPRTLNPVASAPEIDGLINYVFWGRIGARLQKLFNQFHAEQVKIITVGELQSRPRETYLETLAFLGVDDDGKSHFDTESERVRIRNLALNSAALRLKLLMEPVLTPIRRRRGGRGLGVLKALNAINTERGRYINEVSPALRAQIHEALKEDICLAESYLSGRKLCNRSLEK